MPARAGRRLSAPDAEGVAVEGLCASGAFFFTPVVVQAGQATAAPMLCASFGQSAPARAGGRCRRRWKKSDQLCGHRHGNTVLNHINDAHRGMSLPCVYKIIYKLSSDGEMLASGLTSHCGRGRPPFPDDDEQPAVLPGQQHPQLTLRRSSADPRGCSNSRPEVSTRPSARGMLLTSSKPAPSNHCEPATSSGLQQ